MDGSRHADCYRLTALAARELRGGRGRVRKEVCTACRNARAVGSLNLHVAASDRGGTTRPKESGVVELKKSGLDTVAETRPVPELVGVVQAVTRNDDCANSDYVGPFPGLID